MNRVTLCGRLTKDVDVRYTEKGLCVAAFTVACERPAKKDQPKEADFIFCNAFGKTGETIGNYFGKGNKILLEGRINTGSYTAKDGTKKYTTNVVVNTFEFVESKASAAQLATSDNANNGGFENFGSQVPFDENIPF